LYGHGDGAVVAIADRQQELAASVALRSDESGVECASCAAELLKLKA